MDLPNKPLYQIGDILICDENDISVIINYKTYNKSFLQKTYVYETVPVHNQNSEKQKIREIDLYNDIHRKTIIIQKVKKDC